MPHCFFRNIFQVECAPCSHILVMMCGSNRACSGGDYISWAAARNQTVSLHQSLDGIFQSKDFYIYIYLQTHEFYAISNVIIIWIYPAFLVLCVHSTCITLHFIAQTSGTAVASKYATFQLGRCRLDEFFGLRRCPLVAVDGVPWLIHWYIHPNMWGIGDLPLNRWWRGFDVSPLWPTNNYHAWHCTIWSDLMMLK